MAIPIMWITFFFNSIDLCVISVHSYGRIEPIFWAIESFPPKLWHLLNICKWIQHRSFWLDVTFTPLVPGLQPFTWLGASNVCTSFRCLYTLCYKFHIFSYNITSNEDNAYMCFHLHSRYSMRISIYYFIS